MAGSFDPYREWLAITSGGQPHNYYDLLGLRPLESDIGKINAAFRRQSDRLAPHLSGAQAAMAQRLMTELTEARMTLLTPTAKRAYDQSLAGGQPTTGPAAPAANKPARWSGSPTPESGDALLPPTALPGGTAGATPSYANPSYPQAYAPQAYVSQAQFGTTPVAAPVVATEAAPQVSRFSASSYRAGRRRRSSSAPLAVGVLLALLLVLGGVYWKLKSDRTVAVADPQPRDHLAKAGPSKLIEKQSPKPGPVAPRKAETSHVPPPQVVPPPGLPEKNPQTPKTETPKIETPKTETPKPEPLKPEPPKPEMPAITAPPKPATDAQPKPDEPPPAPNTTASPAEAAAVSRALRAARAALALRDFALAQEQLDQATLEATAPDTLAEVERVELLASYVQGFWEAARGTLAKLQVAEEITIDGEVASVVDVGQDRLTLRAAGRNREYTLGNLPAKIALYLARRWLAPDDPASDVAVAAFQMVDPKGDRTEARRLLQSAAAGGIKVKPLLAELEAEKK